MPRFYFDTFRRARVDTATPKEWSAPAAKKRFRRQEKRCQKLCERNGQSVRHQSSGLALGHRLDPQTG